MVLENFTQYGEVVAQVAAGNWVHIMYRDRLAAEKALGKNGKVFAGNVMIGVVPCQDLEVMGAVDESAAVRTASSATPSRHRTFTARNTEYDVDAAVVRATPQPARSYFSRAVEFIFGW
jgi:nuclear pore complex protein Nup53